MRNPLPITAETLAFLAGGMNARRTHGDATLCIIGDEYVMTRPGAESRLWIGATNLQRLNAHWQGFAASPAASSSNPTIVAMRVALYWIEASHKASNPAFDLRVAARALRTAIRHANRAGDNAAKRVAFRFLNIVRARAARLA